MLGREPDITQPLFAEGPYLRTFEAEVGRLTRTAIFAPPVIDGGVSMIEIGTVDPQPCGSTHVARTREIGAVRVSKTEKKGRQNRRISLVFE